MSKLWSIACSGTVLTFDIKLDSQRGQLQTTRGQLEGNWEVKQWRRGTGTPAGGVKKSFFWEDLSVSVSTNETRQRGSTTHLWRRRASWQSAVVPAILCSDSSILPTRYGRCTPTQTPRSSQTPVQDHRHDTCFAKLFWSKTHTSYISHRTSKSSLSHIIIAMFMSLKWMSGWQSMCLVMTPTGRPLMRDFDSASIR